MSTDSSSKNHGQKNSIPWSSNSITEENMQRLDRLANLGTLSAGVAHEIKNGLTPIKTFIELLLQKSGEMELAGEEKELASVVARELVRIDSMASQMLKFAAPKAATFSSLQIQDVLEHSLRLLQHQLSGKMISVKRDYKATLNTARADESRLQQVFMNILFNAMEAMGTNGILTLSTDFTETGGKKYLLIIIHDTGVGISTENLSRLFEPFFTTKKNGTGLGLAISQRIILEHQGKIEVKSELHKGSTFTISLPTQ